MPKRSIVFDGATQNGAFVFPNTPGVYNGHGQWRIELAWEGFVDPNPPGGNAYNTFFQVGEGFYLWCRAGVSTPSRLLVENYASLGQLTPGSPTALPNLRAAGIMRAQYDRATATVLVELWDRDGSNYEAKQYIYDTPADFNFAGLALGLAARVFNDQRAAVSVDFFRMLGNGSFLGAAAPLPTQGAAGAGAVFFDWRFDGDSGADSGPLGNDLTLVGAPAFADTPPVAPRAQAGPDQTVATIATVTLDGTGSRDPDGAIASYLWSQVSGPSAAIIDAPAAAVTDVHNFLQGVYVFQLQVTDDDGLTATDTVQITAVANPTAAPGGPYIAQEGEPVIFDGSASASYTSALWTFSDGYESELIRGAHAFLAPGVYAATLTVKNDLGTTATQSTTVVVSAKPQPSRVRLVNNSAQLQAALDNCVDGDAIELAQGGSFVGPITIRARPLTDYVYIRRQRGGHFPLPGYRVAPADRAAMPEITGADAFSPALQTDAAGGVHHYRIEGLCLTMPDVAGDQSTDILRLGWGQEDTLPKIPHHIIVEQCLVTITDQSTVKRGISVNAQYATVRDCYLDNLKRANAEGQGIQGHNTNGPICIVNNYIEASGIDILFGGAPVYVDQVVPSDIEIRRNFITKRLAWRGVFTAKNLIEFKAGRRASVQNNSIKYSWLDAQTGYGLLFTPTIEGGGPAGIHPETFNTVRNIEYRYNHLKSTASGMQIYGSGATFLIQQRITDLLFRHNLWEDLNGAAWGINTPSHFVFLVTGRPERVFLEHNTISGRLHTGTLLDDDDNLVLDGWRFENNALKDTGFGIRSGITSDGLPTLEGLFTNTRFRNNLVAAANPLNYPNAATPSAVNNTYGVNYYPADFDAQFVNAPGGDFHVAPGSPGKAGASDGSDVGADLPTLFARIGDAEAPVAVYEILPVPPPPPAPEETHGRTFHSVWGGGRSAATATRPHARARTTQQEAALYRFSPAQLLAARTVANVGRGAGASEKQIAAALVAGFVESRFRGELPAGEWIGVFRRRAGGEWGNAARLEDLESSARQFYARAARLDNAQLGAAQLAAAVLAPDAAHVRQYEAVAMGLRETFAQLARG